MKTKRTTIVAALISASVVTGCVVIPTAPTLPALPGTARSPEQFHVDDANCRNTAQATVSGPGQAAVDNAAANAAVGTLIGATAGALIGAGTGSAGQGAAIGAGTGLLFGSAAGGNYAGYSSSQLQYQYDAVYLNCMYRAGHAVPSRYVYQWRAPRYADNPPPDYQPPRSAPPDQPPAGDRPSTYPAYPPPNTPPPRG